MFLSLQNWRNSSAPRWIPARYNSASEVVREALRLLEEHDQSCAAQLAEFNQELGRRLDSLDCGQQI